MNEVLVVDNASTDGTEAAILARFPEVRVLANTENLGFGAANNQAMRLASGEFFLLLNSDAFPLKGSIHSLWEYLQAHPETGVVGPRLLFADGSHQVSIHCYESPFHAWKQYSGICHVIDLYRSAVFTKTGPIQKGYLKGACLLVRRAAYEAVQGFDETFFFYGEEADWQRRMEQHGWRIAYLDSAHMTHLEGKSGDNNRQRLTLWYYASGDYFVRKHYGITGLCVYRLAIMLWCLRKIIQLHFKGLRTKVFYADALAVHRFLLRHLFTVSHEIGRAIPSTLEGKASPVPGSEVEMQESP